MKKTYTQRIKASALVCFLAGAAAMTAKAQNAYFDVNGATAGYGTVTGSTYSWDANNWGVSGGTAATTAWTPGTFARFLGSGNYTVTVNASESMAGMWQDASGTLTINDAGANTGALNITATGGPIQGFLLSGPLIINAQITGSGGIDPEFEAGSGQISLFNANNNYSGGTALTSSSALVNYNNNNSFGTGTITATYSAGSFAPLISTGGATITLPNNIQNTGTGGGINFANGASTPVVLNGTVSMGSTAGFQIRNNGNSTAPLTFNNVISGTAPAGITFSGANGGTIFLNAQNTYTGNTVIGVSGATAITLQAEVANAIIGGMTMAGGKFSAGGNNQSMGTLGMTVSSTMMFGSTANTTIALSGAAASFTAGQILNIGDWQGNSVADGGTSTDLFRVGTSSGTLTTAEEAQIEVNGNASTLGDVIQDASGYLEVVPEPSSLALGALGGIGMLWMVKRRKNA